VSALAPNTVSEASDAWRRVTDLTRYTHVAQLLHWLTALLMFSVGRLAHDDVDARRSSSGELVHDSQVYRYRYPRGRVLNDSQRPSAIGSSTQC
jgi:hypothetical protein